MITARALLACVCSAALVTAFAACSSNDSGTQTSGTQASGTASAGTTADIGALLAPHDPPPGPTG